MSQSTTSTDTSVVPSTTAASCHYVLIVPFDLLYLNRNGGDRTIPLTEAPVVQIEGESFAVDVDKVSDWVLVTLVNYDAAEYMMGITLKGGVSGRKARP